MSTRPTNATLRISAPIGARLGAIGDEQQAGKHHEVRDDARPSVAHERQRDPAADHARRLPTMMNAARGRTVSTTASSL